MAKVSYVPYDESFVTLFEFCNVAIPTVQDFGGNQGWSFSDFMAARQAAEDYLNNNYEESFETWFDMLDSYSVYYWSTEKPGYY